MPLPCLPCRAALASSLLFICGPICLPAAVRITQLKRDERRNSSIHLPGPVVGIIKRGQKRTDGTEILLSNGSRSAGASLLLASCPPLLYSPHPFRIITCPNERATRRRSLKERASGERADGRTRPAILHRTDRHAMPCRSAMPCLLDLGRPPLQKTSCKCRRRPLAS